MIVMSSECMIMIVMTIKLLIFQMSPETRIKFKFNGSKMVSNKSLEVASCNIQCNYKNSVNHR